ncbi:MULTISPECIES: TadE/TadG family type IV pilus assembly protein [unclassified Beijerinckia]|uniref:TadE/TadG family type IV pilus assembly protein n=1 Tax=unclassified Beijerinckia TaxID=2638183 RepID=UPI00089BCCEB|nr:MULTISPECIES: TadE/TadG family type IV pilus assembly protein [unclassified Beijerinckia]MDH7796819.1 Flp pilus assembly protein TadG [Beijerinckia sp. GAS462]SEC61140.1 TadE-like protein [Beijerinckia sp. 28-YEA-48]
MAPRHRASVIGFIRRLRHDKRGVAAVEFALILPLMLLLYLGTAELTQGIMASRKSTLVARALSDLVAQLAAGSNMTDTETTNVFNAATAIMSPFPTTTLKMAVASVEFVANSAKPNGYDAKPRWTITRNGGTARPCAILTAAANTDAPASNKMPNGMYGSGSIIVADVSYTYDPPFGGAVLAWSSAQSVMTMSQTTYMRPRNQILIAMPTAVTGGTICPAY